MTEDQKYDNLKKRIKSVYDNEKKEHKSKQIVIIKNNTVFPLKNDKVMKIVQKIENLFLKEILAEDFVKYTKTLKNCDMTTLKNICKKHSVDLCRLNGYSKYICDTEDPVLRSLIEKTFLMYS